MLPASVAHWLEMSYYILGGIGLFMLALSTLLFTTSRRGIPQLRGGSRHRHVGAGPIEECRTSLAAPGECDWSAYIELTNIGSEFLVVQHGGIRTADGGTYFDGEDVWQVGTESRNGPFGLAPGEIAARWVKQHDDRAQTSDVLQVNLLVRPRFKKRLEEAFMRITPSGSTGKVTFGVS